jgi:hypothetical protein
MVQRGALIGIEEQIVPFLRHEAADVQHEGLARQVFGRLRGCLLDRRDIEAVVDPHDARFADTDAAAQVLRHAVRYGDEIAAGVKLLISTKTPRRFGRIGALQLRDLG